MTPELFPDEPAHRALYELLRTIEDANGTARINWLRDRAEFKDAQTVMADLLAGPPTVIPVAEHTTVETDFAPDTHVSPLDIS